MAPRESPIPANNGPVNTKRAVRASQTAPITIAVENPAQLTLSGVPQSITSYITNLGPVTGLYTPPDSCFHTTTFVQSLGNFILMNAGDTTPGPCWPSIVGGTAQTAYADPDFSQYFSPAFCPSGWVTASTLTTLQYNTGVPSASVFACCPSAVPNIDGIAWDCIVGLYPYAVLTNVISVASGNPSTASSTFYSTTTLASSNAVQAQALIVMWESSDLSILGSTTGSVTTTSSSSGTQSSSSPTPTGHRGVSSGSSGLSGGAKTGIAISIVVRRGNRAKAELQEKPLKPNTHELNTTANTHEMLTKHNLPEINEQESGKLAFVPLGVDTRDRQVHELDPNSRITSLNADEMFSSPQELGMPNPSPRLSRKPISGTADDIESPAASSAAFPAAIAAAARLERAADKEKEEQKLNVLKDRIERIREEKERLTRIQKLESLEDQTKREILETQNRASTGGRIQDLATLEEEMKREIVDTQKRVDNGSRS